MYNVFVEAILHSVNSSSPNDSIQWQILVNIGLSNILLPDGTEPLPEPKLTYHQRGSVADLAVSSDVFT